MTVPIESRIRVRGAELAYFRWEGAGPTLLFAHATGFHARVWDQVINRLEGRRAISIDLRGHGRSEKPNPANGWRGFGEDVAELVRLLDLDGIVGVGHSMGGHSMALAAAKEPGAFRGLVLIDPTLRDEASYGVPPASGGMDHIRRRRNQWASDDEMFESFRKRGPFDRWDERVLRDYCKYGLLPAADGGYELACPPDVEADSYSGGPGNNIYPELRTLVLPVHVILGRIRTPDMVGAFDGSVTSPDFFVAVPQATQTRFGENSHFLPMEAPEAVAAEIESFLDALSG